MKLTDIKQTLKQLRKDHHLTQEMLAQKLYVSRQTISNWENGKSYPDITHLHLMSQIYGENLLTLFSSQERTDKRSDEMSTDETVAYDNILTFYICFLNILSLFTPLLPPIGIFILVHWREYLPKQFFKISFAFLSILSFIHLLLVIISGIYLFFH